MSTKEDIHNVLRDAKQLIEDPKNWLQGMFACDSEGYYTDPKSNEAVRFCSFGAVLRTTDNYFLLNTTQHLLNNACEEFKKSSMTTLNDSSTHETVMKVFNRAMELNNASEK